MKTQPKGRSGSACREHRWSLERVRRGRRLARPRAALALLLALAPAATAGGGEGSAGLPPALRQLAFVENLGQWDTPASFVASLGRTVIQVEPRGFVVDACPGESEEWVRLRFELEGSRADVQPAGEAQLPGLRNYLLGDDPERWRSGARSFARVVYRNVVEGVDLRLREADGMPEYDLLLAPGADLSSVVVRCEGVSGLEVDERGGLRMQSAQGDLRQSPPVTWCVLPSGERQPLECEFVVLGASRFGFRLAAHDPELPVVIDPCLEWATFLGGSLDEEISGVARRPNGEIVVCGQTSSFDFWSYVQIGPTGGFDGFVSILNASGSTLLHSTVVGGSGEDGFLDVELDAAGNVFLVGYAASGDFPTTADGYQRTFQGGFADAVVVEMTPDAGALVYSSFLGGSDTDLATDLELREPRVLSLIGGTRSVDFPITPGAVQMSNGGGNSDFFVCRLDLDQLPGSQLSYGTYLGGSGNEAKMSGASLGLQSQALREDAAGKLTLSGRTTSADIATTANGFDTSWGGAGDAYLARIDPSAGVLEYATFVGMDGNEGAPALAVDSAGVVTLGGWTYSSDFPTTSGAFDTTFLGPAGFNDAFLVRLDPSLPPTEQLLYGTFLSGEGYDNVGDLELDSDGKIIAQGLSGAYDLPVNSFPTTCGACQPEYAGEFDGFVLYLDPAGNGASDLLYSTFVGGAAEWDSLKGGLAIVAEDPALKVLSSGASRSPDFPTTQGVLQENHAGNNDGVLLQLEINPHTYCVAAPNSANPDGALICGTGSVNLSDNDFTLSVTAAAPGQPGLFFFGATPLQLPFGNGYRCVGGGVDRLNPPGPADSSGVATRWVDFGTLPGSQLTPGTPWYFQYWYRDPAAGGASFNLSNGLKVVFNP